MSPESTKSAPRILVVEGRAAFRDALKQSLNSTFLVSVARSSEGALGGFSIHRPRAVFICEKQSGAMDGLALAAELRSSELGGECLLVVYGGTQADAAQVKKEFGVDEYLDSKVTLRKIDELLCQHLRIGWSPMAGASEGEDDTDRFRNPMVGGEVMSARAGSDGGTNKGKKAKKKGFISRLFGS